eukprot:728369-Hanusia_phi.AAC.5
MGAGDVQGSYTLLVEIVDVLEGSVLHTEILDPIRWRQLETGSERRSKGGREGSYRGRARNSCRACWPARSSSSTSASTG